MAFIVLVRGEDVRIVAPDSLAEVSRHHGSEETSRKDDSKIRCPHPRA